MTAAERRAKADELRDESYEWDRKAKDAKTERWARRCRRKAAELRNYACRLEFGSKRGE